MMKCQQFNMYISPVDGKKFFWFWKVDGLKIVVYIWITAEGWDQVDQVKVKCIIP